MPTHAKEGHTPKICEWRYFIIIWLILESQNRGWLRKPISWATNFPKRRWGRTRKGSSPCGESLGQSQSLVKASSRGGTRLLRGINPPCYKLSKRPWMENHNNPPRSFFGQKRSPCLQVRLPASRFFWDKSSDGQTVLGSMGFSIGEMGWLVEIVGLLWAGTIHYSIVSFQWTSRIIYMIQPSVSFCMVWSNAFVDLQCFDWSEQKRVFSSPKNHLFNRAMGLPKHERNGSTPKLPTAFFLRLLPGKEVWPHLTRHWQDEEKPKMEETGETEPQAETWSMGTLWLKSVLPANEVRYNSGPGGCHVVCWGWTKKWLQSASLRPKNLEGSARSGELFFWGLSWMKWNG